MDWMVLGTYVEKLSLSIVTITSVYIFDFVFIISDYLFSGIIQDILEGLGSSIFNKKIKFKGKARYIPNFIVFIILIIFGLPFLIGWINNLVSPILIDLLNGDVFILLIIFAISCIILYFSFIPLYYKLNKTKREIVGLKTDEPPKSSIN